MTLPNRTESRLAALEVLSTHLYFGKEAAAKLMASKTDSEEVYAIALFYLKVLAEHIEVSATLRVRHCGDVDRNRAVGDILQGMGRRIITLGDEG
jgi:hypothetical protein